MGVFSTFAWYQVAGASVNYTPANKATIATYKDDFGVGDFTVAVVLGSVDTAVDYTDSTGHTYYYLADGTTKVDAGMADVPTGESTVGITITIAKGDMTQAQCLAAWETARSSKAYVKVAMVATTPVKVGSSSSGAYGATKGNTLNVYFTVSGLEASNWASSGDNYVYTSSTQAWFYGVEGANSVETGISNGTVTATPSLSATNS